MHGPVGEQALKPVLARLADGATLNRAEARAAFEAIMSGLIDPPQIAAFLMAMRVRGETVDEITGGADVLRAKAATLTAPAGAVDTCGTGGSGHSTYNVSTAAAIIAAACGVPVAKHGNRAASSKSGSADVLEALGVDLELSPAAVEACLTETGIGFLFARQHHSAMRHVAPVRHSLGLRTIFNLLGPLSNPAGARRQVLGVYDARWLEPMAEVLKALGSELVWVVHGSDGLDEITVTGPTEVAELRDGTIRRFTVRPEDVGLTSAPLAALIGGDPAHNAAALRDVLAGQHGAYRDIAVINAAAALVVADKASALNDGCAMAAEAIDDGRATALLDRWVATSRKVAADA